ncbi:RES family NAD+ phosphorylase [Marinimicrobium sp. ABcell2]|uniref:RES family NAD+ phosphorylase n=1 Tax=Marinimicrobium sp. ABcell2 TaxID=3069751 RepID=UPI0027AF211C|nr:RES family NAD+ phosphorylase [Marinimicrobium sp. ABcell2]MDQ2077078.1 RES family NAD+ phosphorylase [Marinimicrobium sp. ABcell2]
MTELFDDVKNYNCDRDLFRNIVSLRDSQDLFDDLSDAPQAWEAAQALEMASKPYPYVSPQAVIDRPFEESAYYQAIQYPFNNWAQSRYSDGTYGVWYGADALTTTIHETAYHWVNGLLADVGWQNLLGVRIERKVYKVHCQSLLLDFRHLVGEYPGLIDPNSYQYTQHIGNRIHREGHPGLVSHSARCTGEVYGVFSAQALSTPRAYCYLSYRLEESGVRVERAPGETLLMFSATQ